MHHQWNWPFVPWQRIRINFAGPFQEQTFFIIVDQWPEVVAIKKTTAQATICKLCQLFSCYGLPEKVYICDDDPQFMSEEFEAFLKSNGVKHIHCFPYHPSSNGAMERFVQRFKKAMRT